MHLVAVSGGIDSMCLAEKVRLSGEPFAMAHCNFSLRGGESDGDEAFVRNWASRHGITCHVKRFDTAVYAASKSISIEMAARELRYRWFGELCREHGYDALLVAHNANDNAETLLLNLKRRHEQIHDDCEQDDGETNIRNTDFADKAVHSVHQESE